jgi:membrane protein YdbS with pleckstrin-like domain
MDRTLQWLARSRTVPDLTVRPTAKFLKAGAIASIIAVLALEIAYWVWLRDQTALLMILPLLILIWPASRALRRQYTKAVIAGDRLRYETGMTSKSTRTIQLTKVQDVRVDQRMLQRVFNVGNISIETAGEASRLTIANVDDAQALADEILNRAQHGTTAL